MAQIETLSEQSVSISYPPVGTYELDKAHTQIEWVARHMLTKVRGRFTAFDGTVEVAERPEDSHVEVEIETGSVDSGSAMRDNHLRSGDFFETETYPAMTFRSTGVRMTGETSFELDGELTIKDVTNPVTLEGEFLGWGHGMSGDTRIFAEARTTVEREAWGLNWNKAVELTGAVIGRKVDLELQVQAIKVS